VPPDDQRVYCDGEIMNVSVKSLAIVLLTPLEIVPVPDVSMHTEGTGTISVVFESGLGDTGEVWGPVQSSVASQCAKTVSYTRRGHGVGGRADGPRDAEHIVAELRARLAASGVPPPYVLVGHSLGGLYMQYFRAVILRKCEGWCWSTACTGISSIESRQQHPASIA
jgi:pimeloyl-ACP methyl ester carboxylesterase